MLVTILDVVSGTSKSGNPYTQAAVRGSGSRGDFLTVAKCPPDWKDRVGEVLECTISFGDRGNLIVPY